MKKIIVFIIGALCAWSVYTTADALGYIPKTLQLKSIVAFSNSLFSPADTVSQGQDVHAEFSLKAEDNEQEKKSSGDVSETKKNTSETGLGESDSAMLSKQSAQADSLKSELSALKQTLEVLQKNVLEKQATDSSLNLSTAQNKTGSISDSEALFRQSAQADSLKSELSALKQTLEVLQKNVLEKQATDSSLNLSTAQNKTGTISDPEALSKQSAQVDSLKSELSALKQTLEVLQKTVQKKQATDSSSNVSSQKKQPQALTSSSSGGGSSLEKNAEQLLNSLQKKIEAAEETLNTKKETTKEEAVEENSYGQTSFEYRVFPYPYLSEIEHECQEKVINKPLYSWLTGRYDDLKKQIYVYTYIPSERFRKTTEWEKIRPFVEYLNSPARKQLTLSHEYTHLLNCNVNSSGLDAKSILLCDKYNEISAHLVTLLAARDAYLTKKTNNLQESWCSFYFNAVKKKRIIPRRGKISRREAAFMVNGVLHYWENCMEVRYVLQRTRLLKASKAKFDPEKLRDIVVRFFAYNIDGQKINFFDFIDGKVDLTSYEQAYLRACGYSDV